MITMAYAYVHWMENAQADVAKESLASARLLEFVNPSVLGEYPLSRPTELGVSPVFRKRSS